MVSAPRNSYVPDVSGYNFINQPVVVPTSMTAVNIEVTLVNLSTIPSLYIVSWKKLVGNSYVADGSTSSLSAPIPISGLIAGSSYEFSVTAQYFSAAVSQTIVVYHTMPSAFSETQIISPVPTQLKTPSKSYLELSVSESNYKSNKYAVAYKSFSSIIPPTYSNVNFTGGTSVQSVKQSNSIEHYTFGGNILMKNSIESTNAIGGIGFFISPNASRGYYVIVETTSSAASFNRKAVRIVKFYGNNIINLRETGTRTESTIEGIYGGRSYDIDIKVKVELQTVTIDAYINGYKITAIDTTANNTSQGSLGLVQILEATNQVALICGRGTVAYDYVYANTITETQYDDSKYILNLYKGQFNNDLISTSFGDLIYTDVDDEIDKKGSSVEEFGSVVREIIKTKVKFDTRPAYPVLWSTGANPNAVLLGTKVSNFGAESYVLNNASTTIPLQDDLGNALYVYGNSLGSSGTLEYVSNELAEYANPEPVIFESRWLQNLSDVKSLADWIKSKTVVVNRGRVVNLKVFGNPLISVGDIISIKHTYVGLAGTENFIITNVNQEYSEGLETSITCRSL